MQQRMAAGRLPASESRNTTAPEVGGGGPLLESVDDGNEASPAHETGLEKVLVAAQAGQYVHGAEGRRR